MLAPRGPRGCARHLGLLPYKAMNRCHFYHFALKYSTQKREERRTNKNAGNRWRVLENSHSKKFLFNDFTHGP